MLCGVQRGPPARAGVRGGGSCSGVVCLWGAAGGHFDERKEGPGLWGGVGCVGVGCVPVVLALSQSFSHAANPASNSAAASSLCSRVAAEVGDLHPAAPPCWGPPPPPLWPRRTRLPWRRQTATSQLAPQAHIAALWEAEAGRSPALPSSSRLFGDGTPPGGPCWAGPLNGSAPRWPPLWFLRSQVCGREG